MNYLNPISRLFTLPLLALLFSASALFAQSDIRIEVSDIRFDDTFKAADEDWIQMEVELKGSANTRPDALNPDYLTNVQVVATVAYDNPDRQSDSKFVFFRSQLTISVLKSDEDRKVYFFMPGDAVKMLRLPNRPPYAYLEFSVEGDKLEPQKDHLYGNLRPQDLEPFLAMANREASRTEGFLIPITQAPFYVLNDVEFSELPAFVRKDEN